MGEAQPSHGTGRITIVGGGLAGLTAATDLEAKGWDVTVLEARPRIGGRVHTIFHGDGAHHAEAGGEFLDGREVHPNIHSLVEKYGLELSESKLNEEVHFRHGMHFRLSGIDKKFGSGVAAEIEQFWEKARELGQLVDPDQPLSGPSAEELDQQSVAGWLDRLTLSPLAREIVESSIRGEYDDPSRVSLLFFGLQMAIYEGIPEEEIERFRIKEGNSSLPGAMANSLQNDVIFNAPVSEISVTRDGVEVKYPGGGFRSDYVIIAAPLPALRKVRFEPELCGDLRDAIETTNYADHMKILLNYDPKSWQNSDQPINMSTDLPVGSIWQAPAGGDSRSGTLITYNSAKENPLLVHQSPQQILAAADAEIGRVFPGTDRNLSGGSIHAWSRHPHSQGSWANYGPGQMKYFQTLRQPQGRLIFVGEHTDLPPGYMEAAVRSGHRGASQIPVRLPVADPCRPAVGIRA